MSTTFQPYDNTNSESELHAHAGQEVSLEPLDEALYDREDTGPMFTATFPDGFQSVVFSDELKEQAASS